MKATITVAIYITVLGYVASVCVWDDRSSISQNIMTKAITGATWPLWVSHVIWCKYRWY